jgi:hypothetical protein
VGGLISGGICLIDFHSLCALEYSDPMTFLLIMITIVCFIFSAFLVYFTSPTYVIFKTNNLIIKYPLRREKEVEYEKLMSYDVEEFLLTMTINRRISSSDICLFYSSDELEDIKKILHNHNILKKTKKEEE